MGGSGYDTLPGPSAEGRYFVSCRWRLRHAEDAIKWLNRLTFDYAMVGSSDDSPPLDAEQLVEAAVTASNAVHQMRCTLDNLICELVRLNGQQVTFTNAFPVRLEANARSRK